MQSGVVGDLVSSSNALQGWEGDVGELSIGDNSQTSNTGGEATDGGQVWCGNAVHVVSVESHRSVYGSQGRNLDAGDVTEGHVGSPDQVGEGNSQLVAIGVDVDGVGDVGDLRVKLLQVVVVVNLQGANGVQVDTAESGQEGVADGDTVGLGERSSERQRWESWKSLPVDGLSAGQGIELEG